jgi:antitoxin component of MazEF toxin-antitoxin module
MNGSKRGIKMKQETELKTKYVRSVIKLGNSKAITFPQEWTNTAKLEEKSEVSLYPLDEKTIIVRAFDKEKPKTIFKMDTKLWPMMLIKPALIAAFKLNVTEIYIKYNDENQENLYKLLTDLRREIIGIDFKNLNDSKEFLIYFLLDTTKTTFNEVLFDLINVFNAIIKTVIEGTAKKNNELLLAEIDRKFNLGRRILITGLAEYPISRGYRNIPIIRFLGDRVILIYIRDFINESLNLINFPHEIIRRYSDLLKRIPSLLVDILKNYDNINLQTISELQKYLIKLSTMLENIKKGETFEDLELRNMINYFLNSFQSFFDIGMTRLVESEVGMV